MLFGDVIAIALSIFGFLLSLQGVWLVCRALWPQRVAAATERCREKGGACFLMGLPVVGVTLLIAVVLATRLGTFGQLLGFGIGFLLLMYAGIGTAGLATHIGQRLASPADVERPWKATVRGAVVLEMAYLVPLLGWFGLLPISLILGAGASTLGILRSRGTPPVAPNGGIVAEAALRAAVRPPQPPPARLASPELPEFEEAAP